ncbi:MAG: sulfotransferase [Akkermansiaceae bacterium]|nr:sulfotransferase [Akkermansiaceae bacterium]
MSARRRAPGEDLDLSPFWDAVDFGPESILHPWAIGARTVELAAVFYTDASLEQFLDGPLQALQDHPQLCEVSSRRSLIEDTEIFDRPVIILSAPRAGSTLLWETLAASSEVWTIGGESHHVIEAFPELNTRERGYVSNRLVAEDLAPETAGKLRAGFAGGLRDAGGRLLFATPREERPGKLRFLEKTPKNALRLPFLRALFPEARFLVLYRDPRENVSSLMEAWRRGGRHYRAFQSLPDWPAGECWKKGEWRMLLPPGWPELRGRSLAEIAAFQWRQSYAVLLDDLARLPADQWCAVHYSDLLADPAGEIGRLCRFADLRLDGSLQERVGSALPRSRATLSAPDAEKWKRNEEELEPVVQPLLDIYTRLRNL